MERVARIMIKVDDADLERWAKQDEMQTEDVERDMLGEVEDFIGGKRLWGNVASDVSFIEWEAE